MSQVQNQYPYWLGSFGTSAGINPLATGEVTVSGSNTTITNALVTTSSVILITPFAANGGLTECPSVTSRSAGSFSVNWPNFPAGTKSIMYLIAKS
jgi:hypothetical protein